MMMNCLITLLSCLLMVSLGFAKSRKLGLDELKLKAIQFHQDIKINQNLEAVAGLNRESAWRRLYLPELKIEGKTIFERFSNGPMIKKQGASSDSSFSEFGPILKYRLFNGFKDYYGLKLETQELAGTIQKVKQSRFEIEMGLTKKFYALKLEIDQLRILEKTLIDQKKILDATKAKYLSGRLSQADLMRGEIHYLDTQKSVVSSKGKVNQLKKEIFLSVGISEEEFAIDTGNSLRPNGPLQIFLNGLEKKGVQQIAQFYQEKYVRHSYRYQEARRKIQLAKLARLKDRSGYFPNIDLEAGYSWKKYHQIHSNGEEDSDDFRIGVNIIIPLFSNLETYQKNKIHYLKIENNKLDVENKKRKAFITIENILLKAQARYREYLINVKKYKLRKRIFKNTFYRFKVGTITLRDVIDDRKELNSDGLGLAQGLFDLHQLRFDLIELVGGL